MKELVIISGKGGTGKTSLVSAFAALSENKVLCDADVDAADLHLIMAPEVHERHDFQSGHTAIIDHEKCSQCGTCTNLCRFDAISNNFTIDPMACEGCGVCHYFCPENAIDFPVNTCGQWFFSGTRFGPMVHAALGIAEENSGKLVTLVRQEAAKLAENLDLPLLITDGPPGIGCPVIAAIGGASTVLIVTEPTVSGIHDMQRVVELAAHFKVPAMMSVNKCDLNTEITALIESHSRKNGLFLAGNIPFDPAFTKAMVQGQSIFEYDAEAEVGKAIEIVWKNVLDKIGF